MPFAPSSDALAPSGILRIQGVAFCGRQVAQDDSFLRLSGSVTLLAMASPLLAMASNSSNMLVLAH